MKKVSNSHKLLHKTRPKFIIPFHLFITYANEKQIKRNDHPYACVILSGKRSDEVTPASVKRPILYPIWRASRPPSSNRMIYDVAADVAVEPLLDDLLLMMCLQASCKLCSSGIGWTAWTVSVAADDSVSDSTTWRPMYRTVSVSDWMINQIKCLQAWREECMTLPASGSEGPKPPPYRIVYWPHIT